MSPRALPLRRSLAPRVRISRRTGWQRRYAGASEAALGDLLAFASSDSAEAARAALAGRLAPLREALLRSPYYMRALARGGHSPRDLRSLDDLAHFPLLDRAALKRHARELPALDPASEAARGAVFVDSSGSGGDPVSILRDPYDCLHMWTVLRFFCRFLGVTLPPRPRVVLLCSLTGGIEYSVRLPLLGDGSLFRISLARERPLERLRRAAPDVVFSDPAGLHWLAAQPRPPLPRLLLTSAQHFAPDERARLARSVPAPVVNYYSSTDVGPIAWECPACLGRFHVLLPDVWAESVAGELVVTRLRTSVLPLLRYRTGDSGAIEPERCGCGYRGFSITGFAGRRECRFVTPGGQAVDAWRLAWLFKHYPLRSFRLTQLDLGRFELELAGPAAGPAADRADLVDRLERALVLLGFAEPRIVVRGGAGIPAPGGKPEPFRCRVAGPGRAAAGAG